MGVLPEFRGQGLGQKIVQTFVRWGLDLGYDRLSLDVAKINKPAQHLYEKNGFKVVAASEVPDTPLSYLAMVHVKKDSP